MPKGARAAPPILSELLIHLGPIWPSRLQLGGVPLGDCWRHPAMVTDDATSGLVPLHKLSQWLAYSLIEPLEAAGIVVTDIDGLTGLPNTATAGCSSTRASSRCAIPAQARSARRRVDPRRRVARADRGAARPAGGARARAAWRRCRIMPLARILQGGTWAAGRAIARERGPTARRRIKVISDGTVF